MTVIAITGHMDLSVESVDPVRAGITTALAAYEPKQLVGMSCIARGADSIFAQCVLDAGGRLKVVIPSLNYRGTQVGPDHAEQFDHLVGKASEVLVLPYSDANRKAYGAANEALLESADVLFAVWDGGEAIDEGSTASVVRSAREANLRVEVVWPDGATRVRPGNM